MEKHLQLCSFQGDHFMYEMSAQVVRAHQVSIAERLRVAQSRAKNIVVDFLLRFEATVADIQGTSSRSFCDIEGALFLVEGEELGSLENGFEEENIACV